jgi:hypothetical protein
MVPHRGGVSSFQTGLIRTGAQWRGLAQMIFSAQDKHMTAQTRRISECSHETKGRGGLPAASRRSAQGGIAASRGALGDTPAPEQLCKEQEQEQGAKSSE